MSLPHSNASAECIFSMVKAIKTDSLHNSTLSALVATKVNFDRYCYEQQSSAELLWLSNKSATYLIITIELHFNIRIMIFLHKKFPLGIGNPVIFPLVFLVNVIVSAV